MRPHILASVLIVSCFCAGVVNAQEDFLDRYTPGTVAGMIGEFTATTRSNDEYVSVTESYMTKTRVTYKGASRKVSGKKREFLSRWLKDNQYPAEMLPTEEFQFRDGENDYWLVMQNIVAPHFVHEIKPGASVDLYLLLMGSVKEDGSRNFVVLINEFKRPEDDRPSGPRTGKLGTWESGDVLKGYERYMPRTLKEVISSHSDSKTLDRANMLMTGDTFPSRVKVTYTGSSRKTPPEKMRHLQMLTETFNVAPEVVARYETEMLFLEGADEHWLPVQKGLIPFFEKELTKGEGVTLYAEWVGARKVDGKWIWIFIVNEFQKLKKPTITGGVTSQAVGGQQSTVMNQL